MVADFLKRLDTSPKIMDITAAQIGTQDLLGVSVVSFTINLVYKTKQER
ncbi:MAG TPA: hypothetical protein P5511_04270 [Candidatus Goldiibacteriota bacterium]|nr:hypothetical protein [Candidatus Goldiibacteriota bacterium]